MILDTNTYTALALANQGGVELINTASVVQLPLPVVAELRYGFVKGSQSDRNEASLQRFLAQPQVTILTPNIKTTEHYATLQLLCKQRGRALSNNDIWIAAMAYEANDSLVTLDKDFTVFAELFGDKLIVVSVV